jgi:AcrR family transcriptional regulator
MMSRENPPTRTRILTTTLALLEEGGGSVRMADIARGAGLSRQALYLHFPNRADLLIAAVRHLDEIKDIDARFAPSRNAPTGLARLDAFIEAWGGYIPEVYGVARALMAMQDHDAEARQAWADRMDAVRQGCAAAAAALERDGRLAPGVTPDHAADLLWTLLSVRNWEQLTRSCGWSQPDYIDGLKRHARRSLTSAPG